MPPAAAAAAADDDEDDDDNGGGGGNEMLAYIIQFSCISRRPVYVVFRVGEHCCYWSRH